MLPLINVVWFKKDLRLDDHAPLYNAIKKNPPLLLLHLYEPSLLNAPDCDCRHLRFIKESIQDIQSTLIPFNVLFYSIYGEAEQVFTALLRHYKIQSVFSHRETGNYLTYERDKSMARFFKNENIIWKEFQQGAVLRGSENQFDWNQSWKEYMQAPLYSIQLHQIRSVKVPETILSSFPSKDYTSNVSFLMQPGGSNFGHKYLYSFLRERNQYYGKHISKPEESRRSCSRLSPYLTYGNISIRQVVQSTEIAKMELEDKRNLSFFQERLRWHCHFIQKLEHNYTMEWQNVNNNFDSIRQDTNPEWIYAWETGATGIPMVDACMRCLNNTGYLNFRMRSMLVSFFTHHLFQPWQAGAYHLARMFLDYEPGIHYSQLQMQAGTSNNSTIRIYNPIKQGKEHDPKGYFIKKWIPELTLVPFTMIHEPWLMSLIEQKYYNCVIGYDYPKPIVDINLSGNQARDILWKTKKKENGV